MMRKLAAILAPTVVLAGYAQASSVIQTPGVTLPPPTPAGMQEMPPAMLRVPVEPETAPSGMLGRGHYTAVSKFVDDDKQTHLQFTWSFDIKKDW